MENNPFKQQPPVEDVKRNSFDLSFSNNLSLPIGKLIPVMCKEVIAGDSFEIDANFGLRFMPTVFPIQNRIRADLHFFYVRNRNLWAHWMDFFGNTWSKPNALVAPYIGKKDKNSNFFAEGSLSDYLGVPTNSVSSVGGTRQDPIRSYYPSRGSRERENQASSGFSQELHPNYLARLHYFRLPHSKHDTHWLDPGEYWEVADKPQPSDIGVFSANPMMHTIKAENCLKIRLVSLDNSNVPLPSDMKVINIMFLTQKNGKWLNQGTAFTNQNDYKKVFVVRQGRGPVLWDEFMQTIDPAETYMFLCVKSQSGGFKTLLDYFNAGADNKQTIDFTGLGIQAIYSGYNYDFGNNDEANATYDPGYLPISALPYRAYESIFNAFYRNERIDPMLDEHGYPEYNKYLQNDGDGVDNFDYQLHNRYWEKDFLTTALPSPQMGNAPLIGLAQNRPFVTQKMILNDNETSVKVASDPDTHQVIGISYYDEKIPVGSIEALNEAISYGISINDFRNVNALQRWLEKSQARGYKYKDQLLSHFGVNVKFEQLNMPEFIGGISQDINSQTIVNQAASEQYKLGEFAGTLSAFGQGNNKVRKYCDEPGFIMAILSISPIPTYSQLLPKMFLKHHRLDYYFPEFGHIGLQPIALKEVVPLQVHKLSPDKKDDTFGYQRSFYDYVQSTDEVHGSLRSSLRNYLINREFADIPALTKQFIEINPDEVNDIFAVTEDSDKVVGQVSFKIIAKRPIPFFGTPTL